MSEYLSLPTHRSSLQLSREAALRYEQLSSLRTTERRHRRFSRLPALLNRLIHAPV